MRVFVLVKNDMKLFFSDWKAVILYFGLPFAFVSLFIYALSPLLEGNKFIEPFNIAIVDKENSLESRMLINQFLSQAGTDDIYTEDSAKLVNFIKTDKATGLEMVKKGEAAGAVIIPEGFVYSMSVGENKPFVVVTDPAQPLAANFIKKYMESYADLISASQNGIMTAYVFYSRVTSAGEFYDKKYTDVVTRFSLKALSRTEAFTTKTESYIPDVTRYEYFTASLLAVFIMFGGIMGIKFTAGEKQLGISTRLNTSPLTGIEYITARFITVFMLSLLQFLSVIIPGGIIFKIYLKTSPMCLFIAFAITVFTVSSWAVFIAVVSPTPITADLAGSLGTLLMAVIGGSIYPLTALPDSIKSLSYLTINRWAVQGFLEIFSGKLNTAFFIDMAVLTGMGLVYLALSLPFLILMKKHS
ncbi:MAG: ABC transporter permease [Clostridiaceae bacterium]|nr:ABC transporter permease [Clostridiaceae bacterium]